MTCGSGKRTEHSPVQATTAYRRREPEKGPLYRVLAEHLETFLARACADESRPCLPRFIERELRGYLHCGLLCHGFARVHCQSCGVDILVAFSCKGRGFCPSCCGRRMAETAAKLVDRVIPEVPVRQWVLSMPWRLRFLLASNPSLCKAVRRSFLRAIFEFYTSLSEREGFPTGQTGAVNVVQRFGSALNLNIHFHALLLDGVYTSDGPFSPSIFHAAPKLEQGEIARLLSIIRTRILRLMRRRGHGLADEDEDSANSSDTDSILPFLSAASIQGRIALGPESGKRIARLAEEPDDADRFDQGAAALCAHQDGFSLHAEVHVRAHDRVRLEHLCRYVARGPIAAERLSLSPDGKVIHELRRPWRDGTTHFVFDPLTFIERLAALVPRPGVHLITYHGVLAPGSTWRDKIVPRPCPSPIDEPVAAAIQAHANRALGAGHLDEGTRSRAELAASATPDWELSTPPTPAVAPSAVHALASGGHPPCAEPPDPYCWSELLRRVFAIDVLHCHHCNGKRKLIALITDPPVVRRILNHLALPTEPPAIAPARPPPQMAFEF